MRSDAPPQMCFHLRPELFLWALSSSIIWWTLSSWDFQFQMSSWSRFCNQECVMALISWSCRSSLRRRSWGSHHFRTCHNSLEHWRLSQAFGWRRIRIHHQRLNALYKRDRFRVFHRSSPLLLRWRWSSRHVHFLPTSSGWPLGRSIIYHTTVQYQVHQ